MTDAPATHADDFADDQKASRAFERSLPWRELGALAVVALVIVVRQLWCV